MPVVGQQGQKPPAGANTTGIIPFVQGSNHKNIRITSYTYTLTAGGSQEFVTDITPGGFLRGVRIGWTSTGGVLGTGVIAPDGSAAVFNSISLENLDGGLFHYPMNGMAHRLGNKYFRPWDGDPIKRSDNTTEAWSDSINPSGSLKVYPELRDSLGILANTDARAKYRVRFTLGPGTNLATGSVTTYPTITVTLYAEIWAQVDSQDLMGNSIQQLPPGLSASHITRHQVLPLNSGGAGNTWQLTNTGNEIRCIMAIVRDQAGVRQDYLSDPIRYGIDDRQLGVESPNERWHLMGDEYPFLQNGSSTRETGVYVWRRFRDPGTLQGQFWLPTNSASYILFESATATGLGANTGTVEWITDEVIPLSPIPVELDGI